jgi:SAM-dependent methyltransferase
MISDPRTPLGDEIIDYWNRASLSSAESSTSHADPRIAFLDNVVEHHRLDALLGEAGAAFDACVDVGAGFGRFTPLFSRRYRRVDLLEPAPRLYAELDERWGAWPGVHTHASTFEAFVAPVAYDLVFVSGVLYLYDDASAESFLARVAELVRPGGLLVLRDFISAPDPSIVPSAYVAGAHCHYRTDAWWRAVADRHGFRAERIAAAKPRLAWIRRRPMRTLVRRTPLGRMCRHRVVARFCLERGDFRLRKRGTDTVFIAMRRT